jgi:exopolyphosphatase/guanosine-5'-triphosphate,3'-diphosphate pyrophosphatase
LFTATLILKNVGERISLANYPKHSYYIVKNGDLPPLEEWESEFIALLCLHQKSGKLTPREIPFWGDKARRNAFQKLLALIRLLDALDPGPDARISLRGVRLNRGRVTLSLSGRAASFESLEMDRRTNLFRKIFHKKIETGRY